MGIKGYVIDSKRVVILFTAVIVFSLAGMAWSLIKMNQELCSIALELPTLETRNTAETIKDVKIRVACEDVERVELLDQWSREGWTNADSCFEYSERLEKECKVVN